MSDAEVLESTSESAEAGNISVVVRIRSWPGNQPGEPCIGREGDNTIVIAAKAGRHSSVKSFTVHQVFDNSELSNATLASQEAIFSNIGTRILQNSLRGFNGCLFAYGQTGSGKSYTMHGDPVKYSREYRGIIPRLSESLFTAGQSSVKDVVSNFSFSQLRVWMSYLEIYNEHLRDLLAVEDDNRDLTVMEHPGLGVYVRDLTEILLQTPVELEKLLQLGSRRRAESVTCMNPHSSRSHAVCRIRLECRPSEDGPKLRSCINLIDLAGSERQQKTNSTGSVLREANSINQSLSTLGMVIKHLTERGPGASSKGSHNAAASSWIPFRSSKLTFLLKDSLAGNSKTFMIACISPSRTELDESVSTLRFAAAVQEVRVPAKVNIDRNEQLLKDLQQEIGSLRRQLQSQESKSLSSEVAMLNEELQERERLVTDLRRSHASQLAASKEMLRLRESALADRGLSSSEINAVFGVGDDTPYMLNVSQDPMLSASLIYYFQPDTVTVIGSSSAECQMVLKGIGLPSSLCQVVNHANQRLTIALTASGVEAGGRVLVNGKTENADAQGARFDDFAREMIHDDSSEAFQELRYYIEEVRNKLDEERMEEFLEVLRSICPLVDEANDMTSELRPDANLRFEVELIWDVYNSPARDLVVIRLLQFHDSEEEDNGIHATVLCYWSAQRFRHQLDVMRDLYHRVQMDTVERHEVRTGSFFNTMEGRLLDAWSDEPADVK
ncbi:kinesin heavy chain, putative [Perkinsus marinus ATCC 50983]|uniref:Kinesin heavy chain, putative n=1 Tax=Perkinsus marinus (strain ATCC 50983 / TXsc) TaxID=423536 RepID=C5KWQ3_PERM5|nr:kinesin heavy chain, putative [Perkinsus marinus ATCC 50983]EER11128.1 kinesin heavy chain, putative [Perkinsus marinus ATCC 50983]|eukprot:XP_002779333.1 kinesin heavy chain, putative [Perkinsus marinus ATCC 50983]